jgi:DNA gyrase subunit B
VLVEIACQFVHTTNSTTLSFVNNITTKDHGTHVLGFKDALLEVVNEFAKTHELLDKKI